MNMYMKYVEQWMKTTQTNRIVFKELNWNNIFSVAFFIVSIYIVEMNTIWVVFHFFFFVSSFDLILL